jgi:triphosphatase
MTSARYPSRLAKGSARVLAGRVLAQLSTELRKHARAARGNDDPERTHRLRVSVRKLRVALQLFRPLLDETWVAPTLEDLRWLFRKLGEVREYDVLTATLAAEESAAELQAQLASRRARARRAARRALSSKRYLRLLRALRTMPRGGADEGAPSARKWARKRLRKRLARVHALRSQGAEHDEVLRHDLRKQLKKLRYAADLFGPLFPQKRVKAYLGPLETLQDLLGDLNDAAVGTRLLREAGEALAPEQREAARKQAERLAPASDKRLHKLSKRLRQLDEAEPFW